MSEAIRKLIAVILVFMVFLLCATKGGNSPFGVSMFAVAVSLCFLVTGLTILRGPSSKQTKSMLVPAILLLAVCVWGWVQTMPGLYPELSHPVWAPFPDEISSIAADPDLGRFAVMRMMAFAMLFFCLVVACEDFDTAILILRLVAVLATIFCAYGLFAYSSGLNPLLENLVNGKSVTSTFINRNSFALFAAFGALANLAAFVDETADLANNLYDWLSGFFTTAWLYAFGFLVCSGALFLSFSRAGVVAALLGLITFAISWNLSRRSRLDWPMLGLSIVVVGIAALANASKVLERILASSGEEARFIVYPKVVQAIEDRPLTGHGFGSFHEAFRPYIPENAGWGEWTYAHNVYLETFMELGIPAAIIFYLAMFLIVLQIYRGTKRRRSNRIFACFAFSCVIVTAFHSIFDFSVQLPGNTALWSVILALGFARGFSTRQLRAAND